MNKVTTSRMQFEIKGDSRGSLVALEFPLVPFEIKRVYYIFGTTSGTARGFHSHKDLEQVAVCVAGSCRFVLDDGATKTEISLNSPDQGLYIPKMTWREMYDFSPNCVLMVLASKPYDESDYIRDYDTFLKTVPKVA
jgi:dTDP-4-dehydrorhamnose 3,5-epimerase-like enzyme